MYKNTVLQSKTIVSTFLILHFFITMVIFLPSGSKYFTRKELVHKQEVLFDVENEETWRYKLKGKDSYELSRKTANYTYKNRTSQLRIMFFEKFIHVLIYPIFELLISQIFIVSNAG